MAAGEECQLALGSGSGFGLGHGLFGSDAASGSGNGDFSGQIVRGAFHQEIEDVGEAQARQHGSEPIKEIAEIGYGKLLEESHSWGMDEV